MGRYTRDGSSPETTCDRCGTRLTEKHWIRLRAIHEGTATDRYQDSEKRICVDCVAALGMLELDRSETQSGVVRDRLDSIRLLDS